MQCKRCEWEIPELNPTEEQKLDIWGLVFQDFKLFAIKKVMDEFGVSHENAKGVVSHLNRDFGKCHRCNFDKLNEEYVECPQCKSFNYNFKIGLSFSQEFCRHLEWGLSFEEFNDERVKGFWCDGIERLPPDITSLSKTKIAKNRMVKMNAYIGKDGQELYEMTIHFGKRSIENYERDLSLVECIPKSNYGEWIKIDPENKKIEVKLR